MKKDYIKPSMAVDMFCAEDNINTVTPLSTVAQTKGKKNANVFGMSVFDLKS